MKRLVTKQKQAIRNVAYAKFNAHLDQLLGTVKILDVEDTLKCLSRQTLIRALFLKNAFRKRSKTHNTSTKIKMY